MRETWNPKPGDRVVRHPRQEEIGPVRVTVATRKAPSRLISSPLLLVYAFGLLVFLGTLLLELPFTHHAGGVTPFMTALFTAVSAVTLTGHAVVDTAAYWTRSGQVIIMGLVFVGGIGYMTLVTFFLVIFGRRLALSQRLLVKESLGINQLGDLARLTIGIVIFSVAMQLIGFGLLMGRFMFLYSPAEAAWQAAFHTVAGFNNAGFSTLNEPGNLMAFQGDMIVLGILAFLIVMGGISYWVILDVARHGRFSRLTLNTRLVLITSAALLIIGTVVFLAAEFNNPQTLGPLPLKHKVMVSLFESVSSRTAGFTAVNLDSTEQHANFVLTSLMFIGGATGSTAGGIKVNTLAVILVAVWSVLRARSSVAVMGREIPDVQVKRAVAILALSAVFVGLMALLLAFTEPHLDFTDLMFEVVSAYGTVGLSTGVTPKLSSPGQLVLIATMLVGKLGLFTLAFALANSPDRDLFRYAQENVTMG